MKKNGMHAESAEFVYTFGIEDKFSPETILTTFLRESKEEWERSKQSTPLVQVLLFSTTRHDSKLIINSINCVTRLCFFQKRVCRKHLEALKSVKKCLENRNIEPEKLLPEFEIKESIFKLEKENSKLNKQISDSTKKRRVDVIDSGNKYSSQEAKRHRFTAQESFLTSSPSVIGLNDARATANYPMGKSSYDTFIPNSADRAASSQVKNYSAISAAILAYGAHPSHDVHSTSLGGTSSLPGVGIDASVSNGVSIYSNGSYSGGHRDITHHNVGQTMYANDLSLRWKIVGEETRTSYGDRFTSQSVFNNPSDPKVDALLRQSLPVDHHVAGLPDPSVGASNHNPSADLYGFADAVV